MALANLCVFCGAAAGNDPAFARAAYELGALAAERKSRVIYGGGGVGLMGALADGVLSRFGTITGVITRQLVDQELAHPRVADMRVVETMHERKMAMVGLADAFVALPGGYGTCDELFEAICWAQLGIHDKPIALLDTGGFYHGLFAFLRNAEEKGFLRLALEHAVTIEREPAGVLDALARRLA
jgi:uncharacterized protein (TIGR00730 family)